MRRSTMLSLIRDVRRRQASLVREEQYWDAFVLGQAIPPDAIESDLAATIRQVHALDEARLPDPTFAARLERELLRRVPPPYPAPTVPDAVPRATADMAIASARWSGLTRRLAMNLVATAALLAIVLASVVVALRVGPLTSRDRVAPLVLAPGITDETLLLQARFDDFPDGILSADIDRWVLQPGAEMAIGNQESGGEGPSAYLVESGTLTVRPDGPIAVTRAGTTTPVPVANGSQIELQSGDRGFAPSGITSFWRNNGATPVRILEAKVKKGDVAAQGEGVLNYTVIGESPFAKPDHPIVMTVVRVTLQPGADLAANAVPGLEMLKVESGRLVAIDVDGEGHPLPPRELGQATRFLRSFPPGRVFRSGDDQPVTLLLVTIADDNPLGSNG